MHRCGHRSSWSGAARKPSLNTSHKYTVRFATTPLTQRRVVDGIGANRIVCVWLVFGLRVKGMVIFTCGAGSAGNYAIAAQVNCLLLTVNPQHAEIVAYFVDCETTKSIQAFPLSQWITNIESIKSAIVLL